MLTIKASGVYDNDENYISPNEILSRLREPCTIGPDVTLKDFLGLFLRYKNLTEFMIQYSTCHFLDEYIVEVHKEPTNRVNNVSELVVRWDVSTNLPLKGQGIVVELNTSFEGYSRVEDEMYSMSLTPLNDMAHLPIIVAEGYKVQSLDDPHETAFKAARSFTLLEVLDAVLYDISFYGGPVQRGEAQNRIMTLRKILGDACQMDENGEETAP